MTKGEGKNLLEVLQRRRDDDDGAVRSGTIGASLYLAGPVSHQHMERGLPKSSRLARGGILAAAVVTCSTRQSSQLASWQAKEAEVVWWWWRLS